MGWPWAYTPPLTLPKGPLYKNGGRNFMIPRGVLPYVKVFVPFWSENGDTLCLFWSGIGYGFQRNYMSVFVYLSFQFQMSNKSFLLLF